MRFRNLLYRIMKIWTIHLFCDIIKSSDIKYVNKGVQQNGFERYSFEKCFGTVGR